MVASFLFCDNRGVAGVSTLYRYLGATPSVVGDTFGTQWTATSTQISHSNGGCVYKGNLYAMAQDGVYVKDDPTTNTGTWTQTFAFTNPVSTTPRTSGLVVVNTTLVLVIGDATGATSWRWAKFDGTTWTQSSGATVSTAMSEMHAVAVYRETIHMIGSSGTGTLAMTFDTGSNTFNNIPEVFGTSQYAHCMCVFDDRLFGIHNSGNVCRVVEFSGGGWIDVPGAVGLSIDTGNYIGKWGLWTDGTYMYGMMPSASSNGWRVLQWDNTLGTPTNLTATVLPSSLRSVTDGGTYGGGTIQNGVLHVMLDQNTDPTIADVWLFQAANASSGTSYSLWKWNGPAALVGNAGVANDTGGDVWHAAPVGMGPGGQYIWTAGDLGIQITGILKRPGAERNYFTCSGDTGTANKTVTFYYNSKDESPITLATLTGVGVFSGTPAGSPSLSANQMLNVDADPTVVYYVDWALTTDGFTPSDRAQLKPFITA